MLIVYVWSCHGIFKNNYYPDKVCLSVILTVWELRNFSHLIY